jgi:hypothetical protein
MFPFFLFAEEQEYKKRVLEDIELDLLMSAYVQEGDNAAVSGGKGNERATDVNPIISITMPLSADEILNLELNISAYTSASSSNVDPFDGTSGASSGSGDGKADPFYASTGASEADALITISGNYSHYSDDRNNISSANLSIAREYDYLSFGFGGGFSKLFNKKNSELSVKANIFLDSWTIFYPSELRSFGGGNGLESKFYDNITLKGNPNYNPKFTKLNDNKRNSFSSSISFSQILLEDLQVSFIADAIYQSGLLSTPFQRVYFKDYENTFIDNFHLADDIERLPDNRLKYAFGTRLNYYLNDFIILRLFNRYYTDDWGINSNTAYFEIPIRFTENFSIYPSYRYYDQTNADYFAPYNEHLSTANFYTSDYDLSEFKSDQYGIGVNYTDPFAECKIWNFGLKSIDFKYCYYERDNGFYANLFSTYFKFIIE